MKIGRLTINVTTPVRLNYDWVLVVGQVVGCLVCWLGSFRCGLVFHLVLKENAEKITYKLTMMHNKKVSKNPTLKPKN